MNKATEEYLRALKHAHGAAEAEVQRYNDRSAYYPCFAGALQAHLGMALERQHGEGIDWDAAREAKAARRNAA